MSTQDLVQRRQPQPRAFDLTASRLRPAAFVAISTEGRKLIQQAEVVAPHLQFATIEGESGVGKQTLAQLLHADPPLPRSNFSRCDAREWLLTEIDPQFMAGFTYLDRIDLLAAPGQGLLLACLQGIAESAHWGICPGGILRNLALPDGE